MNLTILLTDLALSIPKNGSEGNGEQGAGSGERGTGVETQDFASSIFIVEVRQAVLRPGPRDRRRAGAAAPGKNTARTVAGSIETEFC